MPSSASTINEIPLPVALPTVDFSWVPLGSALGFTAGGNSYPYTHQADAVTRASDSRYLDSVTPTNTLLTFTASVTTPPNITILEYAWNFEDGVTGYGSTVTHTYLNALPGAAASLKVTDNLNRQFTRKKYLNLRVLVTPLVRENINVS